MLHPIKEKLTFFVGGAPCQAFSIVGEQRGFEDTRGTLFREFARVVKECQPKVFIFENVQGLFKHDQGRTWEVVYNTFKDYCGYDVHFQLLNARDYGIPQTRERLYCIGFKKKTKFKYPAPIPLKYKMYDFLEDYTDSPYYVKEKNAKVLSSDEATRQSIAEGSTSEGFNDFVFTVNEIEDKYYLSEKVAKYVLCPGTKTFIEGDDTKVKDSLLSALSQTITDGLNTLTDEDHLVKSVSVAKLEEMKNRLQSGYTSFWS